MARHFLDDVMDGSPEFHAAPWYNPDGDCIVYQMANEAIVADRIDPVLTVYRSAIDRRPIGFQIKGVQAIIRKFGFDGLAVAAQSDDTTVRSISIVALLLAAYEQGPLTFARRLAYASAIQGGPEEPSISADELAFAQG